MRKIGLAVDHTTADLFCAPKHKLKYPPLFSGSNGNLVDNGSNFIEMDLIEIVTQMFFEPGNLQYH